MSSMQEMVNAVKQHAQKNYNTDGWDYVVEAFEDDEIADELRKCNARTNEDAIKVVHEWVLILDDHRKDIQATAF